MDHVAKDAPAAVVVELQRPGHLLPDADRHDRRDDQLRVRVLQRRPGGAADVLEEHAVDQPRVLFQIDQAVAVDPQDLADVLLAEVGHRDFVVRALDDDLVGADAVHLVVDAIAALVEVALDLERGELVGHDADAPALFVGAGVAVAVGEDLVRRVVLAALAERAEAAARRRRLDLRRDRPLGPVGGDDDPAANDRILAQLRHRQTPQ